MDAIAIADCLIALAVAVSAAAALNKDVKATRETVIKSALWYLAIALLLVVPLLISKCDKL